MKTTLELPDELLIAAKKRAVEWRRPLRSLVEEGLRAVLKSPVSRRPVQKRRIQWVIAEGRVPWVIDVADRAAMHDWLRRDP
ncbi:MAG: hypothetical protein HY315_06895 [Acidobacteria bacterium]|nr:hypothetical protein [Acidobacteriota bacterium]